MAQPAIEQYTRCHLKYGHVCIAYAKNRDGVALRESPKSNSPVIETVALSMTVLLLDPSERDGWMRAQTQTGSIAREAWVRRSEIAMAWDFHRVVGCWPVEELNWTEEESGDAARHTKVVRSDTQGKLKVRASNDDGEEDVSNMAVWYANGIFRIANIGQNAVVLPVTFFLDYPQRTVRIGLVVFGEPGDPPFRFASDEELKSCTTIPIVDPKQPMLKEPKKK